MCNQQKTVEKSDIMKIKDITEESKNITVDAEVSKAGEIRTVNTRFGQKNICTFTLTDETGSISFSAWEEGIKIPMKAFMDKKDLRISGNTYVTSYKGVLQLNMGKGGKVEVI